VKALKESRFVYTPPPPSWKRTALTAWVKRDVYGKRVGIALAGLIAVFGGYYLLVTRPAMQAQEQARVEVSEVLPKQLRQAHADVLAVAIDETAKQKAATLLSDGERAVRSRDKAAMIKIRDGLTALRDELTREYTLTIVSRTGESTGVWRRPPAGSQARNYYIIVEPLTADGRKLSLPIRNEETGAVETVSKFGVRVSEAAYKAVADDKRDDGIVQNNRLGVKKRGMLAVEYLMQFEGGFITKW